MHPALWIARKNYLFGLMKKVSEGHGGDEPDFFQAHYHEVLETHQGSKIEEAIKCYEQMVDQLKFYPERNRK